MLNKTIVALLCITALTITALVKDIDGTVLFLAFSAIGAIVGVPIGMAIQSSRTNKNLEDK